MTQDEIIEMAKEASLTVTYIGDPIGLSYAQIAHFAKLVAAKEREACAKIADQISDKYGWGYYGNEVDTADEIADAIRARGKA